MKDIYYYGSLSDDINLIKEKEKDIDKLSLRSTITAVLTIILDIVWFALGVTTGRFTTIWLEVWATNKLSNLFRDIINDKIEEKESSITTIEKRIKEFCIKLHVKKHVAKDLAADVDYRDLKDAVIITKQVIEDNNDKEKNEETKNSIDDYVEVLVSDIYYLDLDNKINALREIKEVITSTDEKNIFGIKVKDSKKSKYYKEVSLQEFEYKDFPDSLPVNITLRLK